MHLRLTILGFKGTEVFALRLIEGNNNDGGIAGGRKQFGGVGGEAELVGRT